MAINKYNIQKDVEDTCENEKVEWPRWVSESTQKRCSHVVNKIAETATDYSDRPLEEQSMVTVTADTFGVDYPEPEKA